MSGLHFTPGRKGKLSKLLRNLYYCQTKQQGLPFKNDDLTQTFEKYIPECNIYNDCTCIQEKVNQIKNGYNDPTQPQSFRVAQLANQRLGGRTTFGNVGLGLGIGANARISTILGGIEGQPGGSPRPLRNR
jgi:hypothetical protein